MRPSPCLTHRVSFLESRLLQRAVASVHPFEFLLLNPSSHLTVPKIAAGHALATEPMAQYSTPPRGIADVMDGRQASSQAGVPANCTSP